MSAHLSSALAKLDDSVRVLEQHLDTLALGRDVSKDQFVQNVSEARQNAEAVRDLIAAERPDADWVDRPALENVIREMAAAAEAQRKELQRRRLIDLAEELNVGTITHRLRSRVMALEALREAAVRELQDEAARQPAKELPGPDTSRWLQWACGSQENASATHFDEIERDFPALAQFVSEMEASYWQPSRSPREISEQGETSFSSVATTVRQASPLAEAAPAFAARYGHLAAAKTSSPASSAQGESIAAAVAQAPEQQGLTSAEAAGAGESLESSTANPELVDAKESTSETYLFAGVMPSESQRKGSRFGVSRSVLITVGAVVAIAVVLVVVSAMSGNLFGKHGSSPAASAASDAAKTSVPLPEAPVSDLELVGQIEQRLKSIQGSSVYVTVLHGTAILEGQVPSEDDLAKAEELALQSSQIKVVRNRLQVKGAGARTAGNTAKPTPARAE